jgi:hypothetical protein
MAHDADTSVDYQAAANESAAAVRKPVPGIQPRGRCHNPLCELDVGPTQLFCDADCEREFERERKRGEQ